MAIKFTEEKDLPIVQRENEFREVITNLASNPGKIVSYVVSEKTLDETWAKVAADKRKMAEAGNELATPVTVKTARAEVLSDDKSVKVYITVTKKIKRTRKQTDAK